MKAAVVTAPGATPQYTDFNEPPVMPGHQSVDLVAAAIHPIVRAKSGGTHYSSGDEFPLVPGVDAVARAADGTIVYTGGVAEPWGTFAQRFNAPAMAMAPIPDGADLVAIAAGMNPGMSSWMPLTGHIADHGVPHTVVVVGPTGMAGGLAVQNALLTGVQNVIAIGRGAADLKRIARMGATSVELIDADGANVEAIVEALGGDAPALVLDYLWGDAAETMFRALGTLDPVGVLTSYVNIGDVISASVSLPASLLRSRKISLSGSGIGSIDMRRYLAEARTYLSHIASGAVTVDAKAYDLADVGEAWEAGPGPRPVVTL